MKENNQTNIRDQSDLYKIDIEYCLQLWKTIEKNHLITKMIYLYIHISSIYHIMKNSLEK